MKFTKPVAAGIDTSDATATDADILDGKSAYGADGKLVGLHICGSALPEMTNPATTDDVRRNKEYINGAGVRKAGTMHSMSNLTYNIYPYEHGGSGVQRGIRCWGPLKGYPDGDAWEGGFVDSGTEVAIDIGRNTIADHFNITPEKIVAGETICGVEGTGGGGTGEIDFNDISHLYFNGFDNTWSDIMTELTIYNEDGMELRRVDDYTNHQYLYLENSMYIDDINLCWQDGTTIGAHSGITLPLFTELWKYITVKFMINSFPKSSTAGNEMSKKITSTSMRIDTDNTEYTHVLYEDINSRLGGFDISCTLEIVETDTEYQEFVNMKIMLDELMESKLYFNQYLIVNTIGTFYKPPEV